jgi:hypothetical protein
MVVATPCSAITDAWQAHLAELIEAECLEVDTEAVWVVLTTAVDSLEEIIITEEV